MIFHRVKLLSLDFLKPYISEETMDFHYNRHHLAYENFLNQSIDKLDLSEFNITNLEELVVNFMKLPDEYRHIIKNFGGGLINHNFFFQTLKLNTQLTNVALLNHINTTFGSFATLEDALLTSTARLFGSGWTWLVLDKHQQLLIINTQNQNNPWFLGFKPLIAIDLWEHAYYIDYRSDRAAYVKALLKIIDWTTVGQLYNDYINNHSLSINL